MIKKALLGSAFFLFDIVAFDLREPQQFQDAQLFVVVLACQIQVESQLLDNRDLERLHELDERAVGVFHVGEMAIGLAHAEVRATVANERMS